jgi:hypothetical protein
VGRDAAEDCGCATNLMTVDENVEIREECAESWREIQIGKECERRWAKSRLKMAGEDICDSLRPRAEM